MPTTPIPVIALTGFLGSGKTTLMNHLLEHNQGLKIGVVVNDYGDINIDAKFVSSQTDSAMELTNGCICCSMDSMELDEAIGQFAYPGSPIDYIVIEASGLAEPADLARTLQNAMTPHTRLDSIVALIDSANWRHSSDTQTAVAQQIEHADFVVINKIDLVTAAELAQIKKYIANINARVRVFTTTNSELDPRLLLGFQIREVVTSTSSPESNHAHHTHLHERYTTTSFTTPKSLDPIAFQAFANEQIPLDVYRAKGIINLGAKGHNRKYRFQLVGKRAELTWTEWDGDTPRTELVFIGQEFDTTKLQGLIAACIDPHPDFIDATKRVALPRSDQ